MFSVKSVLLARNVSQMRTTLVMPTVNEVEGMRAVMPRVDPSWVDEILVVDLDSTDGTQEYAREHGYRLIQQQSRGVTGASTEGTVAATGDVVILFSPDNNSLPECIPPLIAKMREGYDMVIVSRYKDGAKSEDDDPVTAFGNWMFTKIINFVFGGHYTDALVMFRAFRKDVLTRTGLDRYNYNVLQRAGFEPLLSIRCARYKLKVAEIPGDEPLRVGSKRKMSPFKNGIAIVLLIILEFLRELRRRFGSTNAVLGSRTYL